MVRSMPNARPSSHQTALLVVDVQERLASVMPDASAVENAGRLIDGARALEMRVLVTEQYPKGLGGTVAPLRDKLAAFATPPKVLEKLDFDACDDAGVVAELDALRAAGVRTLVVAGMEAHICVAQTARGLVDRGFHVLVASDATASRAPENRRIAESIWASVGAHVTSTEAVLFDLVQRASGDRFKAISKLVR
jgi:nicotinamidase-related amidase